MFRIVYRSSSRLCMAFFTYDKYSPISVLFLRTYSTYPIHPSNPINHPIYLETFFSFFFWLRSLVSIPKPTTIICDSPPRHVQEEKK